MGLQQQWFPVLARQRPVPVFSKVQFGCMGTKFRGQFIGRLLLGEGAITTVVLKSVVCVFPTFTIVFPLLLVGIYLTSGWRVVQYRNALIMSRLSFQLTAYLHIQSNEFFPTIMTGIVQGILSIDPTNVRAVIINSTAPASLAVMSAYVITPIQELRFIGQVNMLAA